MKARIQLVVVALAVVMVISGSVVAVADAVVPFKATYVTYPNTVGEVDGVLMLEIPAEGRATHLGESTWYAEMWVDTNSYPWPQGAEMTFTAANGDQLFGSYTGYAIPTEQGVEFWGDFQISGGSGRFEGATAVGTYQGAAWGSEGILHFNGMLTK